MKHRRDRARTRRLAALAGAAIAALATAEVAHVWRRGGTPRAGSARARELARGRRIAARETVHVFREGYRSGSADETAMLNLFLAFGVTFGAARAITHSIRRGAGPFGNVRIGRRHIHHFVPGIALTLGAGGVSIALRTHAIDPWLAVPFGAGAALIIDETALLIELEDVYWADRGVVSIDVGFGATAALAVLTLVVRLLRRGEAVVLSATEAATRGGSVGAGPSAQA